LLIIAIFVLIRLAVHDGGSVFAPAPTPSPTPDVFQGIEINSQDALLVELDSNGKEQVLFDKNGEVKAYPASLTKMMTAIVAIENIPDLSTKITLNNKGIPADMSRAGFLTGETVSANDLLYGMLLPSGAECAIGLADYVAGSQSAFVDMMNKEAQKIGMSNTNFANCTGDQDEDHYTTARDMVTLVEYVIKNDTFYKVFTTSQYSTAPTNKHKNGITFHSTLFSRLSNPSFDGGQILGGKTGYTKEAGQCLATLSEKDGNQYILVTLGADGDNTKDILHIDDAVKILSLAWSR